MRAVVLVLVLWSAAAAHAQSASERTALFEASLRQQWAGIDEQIRLRKIDKQALEVTNQWRAGGTAAQPTGGDDGRVVLEFGTGLPRILCRPERLCDIELQPGERFVGEPMIGDQARWIVEPAASGNSQHVVIKPKYPNITTNLAIYTDRRVYHLELQSTTREYMAYVSFSYPEDRKAKWLQLARAAQVTKEAPRGEKPSKDYEIVAAPGRLNFGYEIKREGRWRMRRRIDWEPKRVFDDGEKTIIEMPRKVLSRELPVLLVRDGDGKDKIVNFRVKGTHFLVDRLFSHAVLVKGVGRRQERVGIYREED